MSGAIPPLSRYAFMVWCSVKAQGQPVIQRLVYFSCSKINNTFLLTLPHSFHNILMH
jgi:hypothetical protein